ncbi:MAG: Rieske (2Fe-2S) protein [Candidatus Krumholzibacteriota bacterium]
MTELESRKTETKDPDLSRRGFFRKVWLVLGALATLQFLWIGFDMLRPRKRRRREAAAGAIYTAGPVERFEPGTVTAFPEGRFYLSRLPDGGFLALGRTCTHLGCTVPWIEEDRRFACPCHASVFDITGEVLSPPADRALDMYAVRIENGIVKVDLGRTIKRRGFETAQVTMP